MAACLASLEETTKLLTLPGRRVRLLGNNTAPISQPVLKMAPGSPHQRRGVWRAIVTR
jgi:hypothetical protein